MNFFSDQNLYFSSVVPKPMGTQKNIDSGQKIGWEKNIARFARRSKYVGLEKLEGKNYNF